MSLIIEKLQPHATKKSKLDFTQVLPIEFRINVLSYLEDCDVLELCMVNSFFNMCFSDNYWRIKFFDHDCHSPALFHLSDGDTLQYSWKHLYFQKKDSLQQNGKYYPKNTFINWKEELPDVCNVQ